MNYIQRYKVPDILNGYRADKVLSIAYTSYSREYWQKIFYKNRVFLYGRPITKNTPLKKDDVVFWIPVKKQSITTVEPIAMKLDILYEDSSIVVVNKPVGMIVYKNYYNISNESALVNGLMFHCKGQLATAAGMDRPGVVHRLDRDTSGVMVFAKTNQAYNVLTQIFSEKNTYKIYHVIVQNWTNINIGEILMPIKRHPIVRNKMMVCEAGIPAYTYWQVLNRFAYSYTLLKCRIYTGRTHQIRVHFQYLKSPIWGDWTYGYIPKYNDVKIPQKLLLHAAEIHLPHPIHGNNLFFKATYSRFFAEHLTFLRKL